MPPTLEVNISVDVFALLHTVCDVGDTVITGTGFTVTFITVVAVLEPLFTCMVKASVPL